MARHNAQVSYANGVLTIAVPITAVNPPKEGGKYSMTDGGTSGWLPTGVMIDGYGELAVNLMSGFKTVGAAQPLAPPAPVAPSATMPLANGAATAPVIGKPLIGKRK
jgi:hypothetical protein